MLKAIIMTLTTTTLFFTACSSYPKSAEGVAKAVCHELKGGNLDALEAYVAPEQKADFKESFSQAKTFLTSDAAAKMFAAMNCDKSDRVRDYNGGTRKTFSFSKINIKVHKINAVWYFSK
jgi:hypothetical protein